MLECYLRRINVYLYKNCKKHLDTNAPFAELRCEDEDESGWKQLLLAHKDGHEIAVIERNPVFKGSLAEEELEEFLEDNEDGNPASAVNWLADYFKKSTLHLRFSDFERC